MRVYQQFWLKNVCVLTH